MKAIRTEWVLSVLLALGLTACRKTETKVEPASDGPATPVHTVTAGMEAVADIYTATGTVRAKTVTQLASRVLGYVRQVNARAGDSVKAGQVLITVEANDLDASVLRASAGLAEAESGVQEAESGLVSARANLELAAATFARMKDLMDKRSISNQEFDEAQARVKAARAAHKMAQARLEQGRHRVAQAAAERQSAEVTRGYAQIVAPFAGVVTMRSVEPGTLATPGAPLMTIEQQGAYRLEVAVDESHVRAVRVGASATVTIDAIGMSAEGRVAEVEPQVDAASRSYLAKIDLAGVSGVRSGLYGSASFEEGRSKKLLVPATAVTELGQLASVIVVENGHARTRLVTLGARRGTHLEVLTGLAAGDLLVHPVPAGLIDGTRVEAAR